MTFLRSLLSVLLLAAALGHSIARADEGDAVIGEQQLAFFETACPASIAANFARNDDFAGMDERDKSVIAGVADAACACAVTRLREFPPAELPRLFGSETFRQINQGCVADGMKASFNSFCRMLYRRALPTAGDDAGIRACDCAQVRVDATSSEQFARLLAGENGGVDRLVNDCARGAAPVSPKDPTP